MHDADLTSAKILIVDDQELNVQLLRRILEEAGYSNLVSATDSRHALPLFSATQPDLVLLDLAMPHLDGFAVMEQLAPRLAEGVYLPILVLTADISQDAKRRALAAGARDFLAKPFDHVEVLLRIKNLLQTRQLHLQLQGQNQILELKVRERTRDLEEARLEILERLALVAEYRDDTTQRHALRVGGTAARLAYELGLPEDEAELIRRAAPLHDVGKIGIPDRILLKPASLTAEEFEIIKTHTIIGARILAGSHSPVLELGEVIALTHHEWWDGGGYSGLKGEMIPLAARIVAVVDVFDALMNERPYKQAWPLDDAVAQIRQLNGQQFDTQVVEAFLRLLERGVLLVDDQLSAPATRGESASLQAPRPLGQFWSHR